MEWWMLDLAGNGIISVAYLAIATMIIGGVARSRQLLHNPLAVATGLIFFTCGIGHGLHAIHLLSPFLVPGDPVGMAARVEGTQPHMWIADGITALVAVWYLTLRGRFPALVRGSSMFEDIRVRQREALEIHDNVVQGLAKAKLNFEVGRPEKGLKDIEDTLAASRKIITDLLGDVGSEVALKPGDLRRARPAATPRGGGGHG